MCKRASNFGFPLVYSKYEDINYKFRHIYFLGKNMNLSPSLLCIWICLQKVIFAAESGELESQQWTTFKTQFNKKYNVAEEDNKRKQIHSENLKKILNHNELFKQGKKTYEMGMNEFGDLTQEEFAKMYLLKPQSYKMKKGASEQFKNNPYEENKQTAPYYKNWVQQGVMTGVKNQGLCGCCWAIATVSAIEAHIFIKTKVKKTLSTQNLIDCVGSQIGSGVENSCTNGYPGYALEYIVDNGIETAQSYPYEAKQGACRYDPSKKAASITDFQMLLYGDEKMVRDFVGSTGPVITTYFADNDFQFYKSGIYTSTSETCGTEANHALVIVGYGTEGTYVDYWLAENSWGPNWGEGGYVRIARGGNVCLIATETFYPIV